MICSSWEDFGACLVTAAGNLPLEIASSSPRRAVICSGVENCKDFLCTLRGRGIKSESCTYMRALELESSIDVNRRMADASFDMCVGVDPSSSPYDGGSKFGGVFGRYIVLCGLLCWWGWRSASSEECYVYEAHMRSVKAMQMMVAFLDDSRIKYYPTVDKNPEFSKRKRSFDMKW